MAVLGGGGGVPMGEVSLKSRRSITKGQLKGFNGELTFTRAELESEQAVSGGRPLIKHTR